MALLARPASSGASFVSNRTAPGRPDAAPAGRGAIVIPGHAHLDGEHGMNVHELIAQVELHVPENAPFGARHRAQGQVATCGATHTVAVAARIDREGRRHEQYFCDGTRVPRPVLLRLTCAESECPQARAVRDQWRAFHGRADSVRSPRRAAHPEAPSRLEEVELVVAGHRCIARSARFRSFSQCPNRAHPPMWFEKTGFDLFEDTTCVGGGVVTSDGTCTPRLPSIAAAEAYLFARHIEARAVLDAAAVRGGPSVR